MSLTAIDALRRQLEQMSYIEGRIVLTPTDLTAAYPYGGTDLGVWGRIVSTWRAIRGELTAQEWYGRTVDHIESGYRFALGAVLRSYNATAWDEVFSIATTTDTQTGLPGLAETIDSQRAAKSSDRAVKILFAPDATEDHPAIYIPAAVPLLEVVAAMTLSRDKEAQIPCAFEPLPDATGRLYQANLLKAITL